ncbi:unnamed protein product [Schistosoma margrebowiei]|uniref:Annexin n=1 Tax=Schistosoma margrebowiei TaxID=48269 RepID=A0A183MT46_9TREM|nr:unnamed protein product [Schistosoma margrebowiei]
MNPNYPDLSAWNLSGTQDNFPNQGSNYPNRNSRYPDGGPGYPVGGPGLPGKRQGLPTTSGLGFSVGGQSSIDGGIGFAGGGPGPMVGGADYTSGYYPNSCSGGFQPSNPTGFTYSTQGENVSRNNPYPVAQSSGYVPGAPRFGTQTNEYNNGSNLRTDQNICQSNPNSEIFEPTVKDAANFNPEEDCERLRKAMAGLGTNEKELIEVMGRRSPNQRVIITKKYKAMFGKELASKFESELSGHFYECMVALCRSPSELDATELRKAMRGAVYKGRSLEKDLKDETSGYFKRILVALVQGDRDESQNVDECRARRDAEELYKAGEQRWGTDESKFIQIICHRSYAHLRSVFQHYSTLGRRDIESALKSEMSGDLLRAMLTVASMKGAGTADSSLIRIVVGRSGIDMARIKKEFISLTGKSLESWIADDTSGDYRRILLKLVSE